MVKHYIRLDEDKNIIKGFSTDFEKPIKDDICILENAPRHFRLEKDLIDEEGKYNYKYINNEITERAEEEKWTQEDKDKIEKERLINEEQVLLTKEQAIQSLKDKGKLDNDGNLIK